MKFWWKKPMLVNHDNSKNCTIEYHFDKDKMRALAEKDLANSKVKLDYKVKTFEELDENDLNFTIEFINKHYTYENEERQFVYDKDTIRYFLRRDGLIIFFTPKGKDTIVGIVAGSPRVLCTKNDNGILAQLHSSLEVNYLCLIPQLRNINAAAVMISTITKESIETYGIHTGHFTKAHRLQKDHYCEQSFYFRPINVQKLIDCGIIHQLYDTNTYIKVHSTFNYPFNFLRYRRIKCFKTLDETDLENSVIKDIHMLLCRYNNLNFKIYEHLTLEDVKELCGNKAFLKFVVLDILGHITDVIILHVLTFRDKLTDIQVKNGSLYCYAFGNSSASYKSSILELVSEYCFAADDEPMIDMLTIMDLFQIKDQYRVYKFTKSSETLFYYWYNMKMPFIPSKYNGLVTL